MGQPIQNPRQCWISISRLSKNLKHRRGPLNGPASAAYGGALRASAPADHQRLWRNRAGQAPHPKNAGPTGRTARLRCAGSLAGTAGWSTVPPLGGQAAKRPYPLLAHTPRQRGPYGYAVPARSRAWAYVWHAPKPVCNGRGGGGQLTELSTVATLTVLVRET